MGVTVFFRGEARGADKISSTMRGKESWATASITKHFHEGPTGSHEVLLCSEFWRKIMGCLGFTGLLEARMVFSLGNIMNRFSEQEEITCETGSPMGGWDGPRHLTSPSQRDCFLPSGHPPCGHSVVDTHGIYCSTFIHPPGN